MYLHQPGVFALVRDGQEHAPGAATIEKWLVKDPHSVARLLSFMLEDFKELEKLVGSCMERLQAVAPLDIGRHNRTRIAETEAIEALNNGIEELRDGKGIPWEEAKAALNSEPAPADPPPSEPIKIEPISTQDPIAQTEAKPGPTQQEGGAQ